MHYLKPKNPKTRVAYPENQYTFKASSGVATLLQGLSYILFVILLALILLLSDATRDISPHSGLGWAVPFLTGPAIFSIIVVGVTLLFFSELLLEVKSIRLMMDYDVQQRALATHVEKNQKATDEGIDAHEKSSAMPANTN